MDWYSRRSSLAVRPHCLADPCPGLHSSSFSFLTGRCPSALADTCTQVLGGYLATRYGGKPVLIFAVFNWSLWTTLTPLAAQYGLPALIACRVFLGFGEGVSMPSLHHVTARWAPAHERSRFVTLCSSGQYLGTLLTLSCAPLVTWWWPSIFVLFGGVGFVWLAAWVWHGASSPADHPSITAAERDYIEQHLPPLPPVEKLPWRRFFTEPACIAIYTLHVAHNWSSCEFAQHPAYT
jgi:MFS family permease